MNEISAHVLFALMRTGAALTASAVILTLALRACKIASPAVHRTACVMVLLQGWMFFQGTIAVPREWMAAPAAVFGADRPQLGSVLPATAARNQAAQDFDMMAVALPQRVESPSWTTWIVVAWAAGMIVLATRAGFRYGQFVRRMPAPLAADEAWIAEWEAVQNSSGVRPRAILHVTEELGPMLCRFPSEYRLVVPVEFWRRLRPAQRRAILRHELAHLERRDVWKSLAVRVLAMPQWFNPLAWWAVRRFDLLAEIACDQAVCTHAPRRAAEYARALLQLGETARGSGLLRSGVRGGGLADRVRRVLQPALREDTTMKKAMMTSLILGLAMAGMVQFRLTAGEPREVVKSQPPARSTTRERRAPRGPARASGREAVIDIAFLFRNLDEFQREKEKLQSEVAGRQQSMKEAHEELTKLHRDLIAESDRAVKDRIETEIARKKADLEADRELATKELRQREAEIYQRTYNRIADEVARYAKANNIRIVRRADLSSQRDSRSNENADPQEIIKRMNQDIIYIEREEFDITDAILERLNQPPRRGQ